MESAQAYWAARAALEWQVELGVFDALSETPINRFELADKPKQAAAPRAGAADAGARVPAAAQAPAQAEAPKVDPVAVAQSAAQAAQTLEALQAAMASFEHCELKRGARNLVFADGVPEAKLMIIGEAPGRDEDKLGRPFVGRAGQLLDKMLAAIAMSRSENVYITNVLPWRPPQNRDPKPEEIAMMRPFVERHVQLVKPDVLILMGNISCDAAMGQRGITRLRGNWTEGYGVPAMPMFHPAYLLRQPQMKREAWADLLEIKARLS